MRRRSTLRFAVVSNNRCHYFVTRISKYTDQPVGNSDEVAVFGVDPLCLCHKPRGARHLRTSETVILLSTLIVVCLAPFGRNWAAVFKSERTRWRKRLPISANWTFFASDHGWSAMSRYWSKFRCLKGGWSIWTQISGERVSPPTIFGVRKLDSLGYRMVKKIAENFNRLSRAHQRHRQTDDRQTDLR